MALENDEMHTFGIMVECIKSSIHTLINSEFSCYEMGIKLDLALNIATCVLSNMVNDGGKVGVDREEMLSKIFDNIRSNVQILKDLN